MIWYEAASQVRQGAQVRPSPVKLPRQAQSDTSDSDPSSQNRTCCALAPQPLQDEHDLPLPKNPKLHEHTDTSATEPAGHSPRVASAWQGRQGEQSLPSPKKVALHEHVDVSLADPAGHSWRSALALQGAHRAQVLPLPQ